MDASDWAAWWGAATGTLALGWEVLLHFTSGPKLKVECRMVAHTGPANMTERHYLRLSVRNKGTAPTTVESISVTQDGKPFERSPTNPGLPRKLEPGDHLAADVYPTDAHHQIYPPGQSISDIRCLDAHKPAIAYIRTSASDKDIVLKVPAAADPDDDKGRRTCQPGT